MEPNYIQEIICKIIMLQKQDFNPDLSGCDRPFLGPTTTNTVYNTRPIQFYNAYTAEPWSFSYPSGDATATSNVFRIESSEDNTVTVRLLAEDETTTGSYTNTNQFVTIRLSTIGAVRCLPDVFVTL